MYYPGISTAPGQGMARKKTRWFLKSHDHAWCTEIVVSWTRCTIIISAIPYCSMSIVSTMWPYAYKRTHILICNGSLKTSVSVKLKMTKKNTN